MHPTSARTQTNTRKYSILAQGLCDSLNPLHPQLPPMEEDVMLTPCLEIRSQASAQTA